MPITSSASISSLIRIAPSCAVAPAPMVAAKRDGRGQRRDQADVEERRGEPVSASTPTGNWL